MRGRLVFAGMCVGVGVVAGVACSIDESGTIGDASLDAPLIEAGGDGPNDAPIDVPQACSTLDASACVDADLPSGWTFAIVASGAQSCPAGDFTNPTSYVLGLGLEAGACSCGCTVDGGYDCSGSVHLATKGACNMGDVFFDAGNDASCIDTSWNDPHAGVVGSLPTVSGSPTCSAKTTGNQGWTASTATACTPGCTADYCGVAAPFARCIVTSGNKLCPAPFTTATTMGTSDKVAVTCDPCGCSVDAPGACGATIVASPNHDCSSPYDAAVPTDNSCTQPGGTGKVINSVLYSPDVPKAACTITDGGNGTVGFTSTVTVCCLPP